MEGEETMTPTYLQILLARGRTVLNRILVTVWFVRWLGGTAAGVGLVILLARGFGWRGAALPVWAGISIAGGLAGCLMGWASRLDRAATARWLDRRLGDGEALSAALVCLSRDCTGPFDGAVLERAESFAGMNTSISWPLRPLVRGSALTLGTVVAFALVIGLWLPPSGAMAGRAGTSGQIGLQPKPSPQGGRSRAAQLSPEAIARALFPDDIRMARLAERALYEGDGVLLDQLVEQARQKMDQDLAQAADPAERERLAGEQQQRREMIENLRNSGNGDAQGDSGSPGEQEWDEEGDQSQTGTEQNGQGQGQDQQQTGAAGTGDGRRNGGQQNGQGQPRMNGQQSVTATPQPDADESRLGTAPGSGHGQENTQKGGTSGKSGGPAKVITNRPDSPMLEYVLPGKNARVPLSSVVVSSKRAAEGALARDRVPGEYGDSVMWYFLQLSNLIK